MKNVIFWDKFKTWQEAEIAWDKKHEQCAQMQPLKGLPTLPAMVGIVEETKKHLTRKSLLWMIRKDKGFLILRHILRHPLKYFFRYLRSIAATHSYIRDEDLFFYGLRSLEQFEQLILDPNSVFVLGFSYCQKPFECPSGRFSAQCLASYEHPVCSQCFVGKCFNALPRDKMIALMIPTIHYIGRKIFEIKEQHPGKKIIFLISTCEMMLECFGDFGNMAGIRGVGVRLGGRFCNTFRSFELAERGVKPGLTVILPKAEKRMLELIHLRRNGSNKAESIVPLD